MMFMDTCYERHHPACEHDNLWQLKIDC